MHEIRSFKFNIIINWPKKAHFQRPAKTHNDIGYNYRFDLGDENMFFLTFTLDKFEDVLDYLNTSYREGNPRTGPITYVNLTKAIDYNNRGRKKKKKAIKSSQESRDIGSSPTSELLSEGQGTYELTSVTTFEQKTERDYTPPTALDAPAIGAGVTPPTTETGDDSRLLQQSQAKRFSAYFGGLKQKLENLIDREMGRLESSSEHPPRQKLGNRDVDEDTKILL